MGKVDEVGALADSFLGLLSNRSSMFSNTELVHNQQQQAYRDLHLALILTDYWLHLAIRGGPKMCASPDPDVRAGWIEDVRSLASNRRFPEMIGAAFDRLMLTLGEQVFGNESIP